MQARLGREQQQDGELVKPVEVVGDDHVGCGLKPLTVTLSPMGRGKKGDVLPALHLEAK